MRKEWGPSLKYVWWWDIQCHLTCNSKFFHCRRRQSVSTSSTIHGIDMENKDEAVRLVTSGTEDPCQPHLNFPGMRFGNETFEWLFHASWFLQWQWLFYLPGSLREGLLTHHWEKQSFTIGGFCNQCKATAKFVQQETSDMGWLLLK